MKLTTSELHALMTSGFATVAGTVIAAYVEFGVSGPISGHIRLIPLFHTDHESPESSRIDKHKIDRPNICHRVCYLAFTVTRYNRMILFCPFVTGQCFTQCFAMSVDLAPHTPITS